MANFWSFKHLETPHLGVSKNRGPQNGWFTMENPIKMDALGVPLFSETSISWWKFIIETLEHVHFSAFSDKKWGAERCYLYPRGNGKITNFLIGHTSSSVFFPLSIVMLVFRGVFPESSKQIWSNDFFVLFFLLFEISILTTKPWQTGDRSVRQDQGPMFWLPSRKNCKTYSPTYPEKVEFVRTVD